MQRLRLKPNQRILQRESSVEEFQFLPAARPILCTHYQINAALERECNIRHTETTTILFLLLLLLLLLRIISITIIFLIVIILISKTHS